MNKKAKQRVLGGLFFGLLFCLQLQTIGYSDDSNLDVLASPCTAPEWTLDSGVNEDNFFIGTVFSQCDLTPRGTGNLGQLVSFVKDEIVRQAIEIHEGPIEETYENLPSVRYNVTLDIDDDEDTLTVLQDMHVASDLTQKFLLTTDSLDVQGTGLSVYVKELHGRVVLDKITANNHFSMHFSNQAKVKKPWFISAGEFTRMVKSRLAKGYLKKREEAVAQFSENL